MTQNEPSNLDDLIDAAARQASKNNMSGRDQTRPPSRLPMLFASVAFVGAVALVVIAGLKLTPPGRAQVERDLDSTLELARQSIEAARTSNGALPEALPNAALAAVVRYQPDQDNYKLVANMLGIRITLQRDGTRSIEKENLQ